MNVGIGWCLSCSTAKHLQPLDPPVTAFAATRSTLSQNETPWDKRIRSICSILKMRSPSPLTAVIITMMLWMLKSSVRTALVPEWVLKPFKKLSLQRQWIWSLYSTGVRESSHSFSLQSLSLSNHNMFPFFPPLHLNILKHFRARRRPGRPGLRCVCEPQKGCTSLTFPLPLPPLPAFERCRHP